MKNSSFTVIIPTFNEDKTINNVVNEIFYSLSEEKYDFEILIIDDGSKNPVNWVKQNKRKVKIIRHQKNMGYGASLKTGIINSSSNLIIIMDADGTYPAFELANLLKFAENNNMVIGNRKGPYVRKPFNLGIIRYFLKIFVSVVLKKKIPDPNSGLRIIKKEIVTKFFPLLPDRFSFTTTLTMLMISKGYKVKFVPIKFNKRIGETKFNLLKDTFPVIFNLLKTSYNILMKKR